MSGLKRVPGVKRYRALDQGIRALGQSQIVQSASLDAARRVATRASVAGEDTYRATPRVVRAGWQHEQRAGAAVSASGAEEPHIKDAENRVLKSAVDGAGP